MFRIKERRGKKKANFLVHLSCEMFFILLFPFSHKGEEKQQQGFSLLILKLSKRITGKAALYKYFEKSQARQRRDHHNDEEFLVSLLVNETLPYIGIMEATRMKKTSGKSWFFVVFHKLTPVPCSSPSHKHR
jgi:hypothetical protein